MTNVAHWVRSDSDVMVVGVGGGRDLLSALTFRQKSVVAVEVNRDIIRAVNGHFGDFTGHLDSRPGVTFVNDEARSFTARQDGKYDIIQISLIDTWAATAAGAFVLAENSLYTVEAFKIFCGTFLKEEFSQCRARFENTDIGNGETVQVGGAGNRSSQVNGCPTSGK